MLITTSTDCMSEGDCLISKHGYECARHPYVFNGGEFFGGVELPQSLPKKMFEQGVSDKIEEGAHAGVLPTTKEEPEIEEVKEEPKVKDIADIMKRYLESQLELMEMIRTLYVRLNKFKEI